MFFSNFFNVAFAKYLIVLAVIRAFKIRHIFYQTNDWDIHHFCHFDGFRYNHGYQLLWRSYDNNPINSNGLKYCKGNIAGSWWHINKHKIYITPDNISPELFNCTSNYWASPYNRISILF